MLTHHNFVSFWAKHSGKLIDTGCPNTVSGDLWINTYIATLSRKDRLSIRRHTSWNKFCFGEGKVYKSKFYIVIPIYIGQNKYKLGVDVIDLSIPLLLSRKTLKRTNAKIDIGTSTICFLGNIVNITTSSSGHLCLPLSRALDTSNDETKKVLRRVLFTSPADEIGSDLCMKAKRLHLQFCHPTSDCLNRLIQNSGINNQKVFDAIKDVTSRCDICIRNKRVPLKCGDRPSVVIKKDVQSYIPHSAPPYRLEESTTHNYRNTYLCSAAEDDDTYTTADEGDGDSNVDLEESQSVSTFKTATFGVRKLWRWSGCGSVCGGTRQLSLFGGGQAFR